MLAGWWGGMAEREEGGWEVFGCGRFGGGEAGDFVEACLAGSERQDVVVWFGEDVGSVGAGSGVDEGIGEE